MRVPKTVFLVAFVAVASGCASVGAVPDRDQIGEALRVRTGQTIPSGGAPSLPPDVSIDDGVTEAEAVAAALWNSPSFHAALDDLGIARADLVDAGLLRNPILSLLFPVGPKQLEWTLQFPIEALWQRPRRIAAAELSARSIGERLVSDGLSLVADVRRAHVDALAAGRRLALASDNARVVARIREITEARLQAGDISELEARAPRNDAAQANAMLLTLGHDHDASRIALLTTMGVDRAPAQVTLVDRGGQVADACGNAAALIEAALASRPDVRAAELAVEAAGRRARWERSRVVNLIATLDANSQGREGYEIGPGIGADLPVFSRNQGAIGRAAAEMEKAGHAYLAVRLRVSSEIRTALVRFDQAKQAQGLWSTEIVPSLEAEQRQAQGAYEAGELALLSLLDVTRRLGDARLRGVEAETSLRRAAVTLDQAVGRTCVGS